MALATLIYVIRNTNRIEKKVESNHIELNGKVSEVQKEVDGKLSQMIDAVKSVANTAISSASAPRQARKTDVIPNTEEPPKIEITTENISVENKGKSIK